MEETLIVIMLKDEKTGFFERELGAFSLEEYEQYLVNVYGKEVNDNVTLYMTVTCNKDVEDWEFNAIYDHYDIDNIKKIDTVIDIVEDEESYDPSWIISLKYNENIIEMKKELEQILKAHKEELDEVFKVIKDKKDEYIETEE